MLSAPLMWDDGSLIWTRDGRMVFSLSNGSGDVINLWEITTDPQTGEPSGKPVKITNWDALAARRPSVSQDANRLVVVKVHRRNDVYVGELKDGGTRLESPTRLTVSESRDTPSAWTSDSKAVLFDSDRTGRSQIFKQALEQEAAEPLLQGPDGETGAQLSPDGAWILYWSSVLGTGASPAATQKLMRLPANGGSPEQVLDIPGDIAADFHCPFHPPGSCVLSRWERGWLIFDALDPVHGRGKELARTKLGAPSAYASLSVSPDGSWVAFASQDQLPEQVRIIDLRKATERNLQLSHGLSIWNLSWAVDGNAIFAAGSLAGNLIIRIELDGKTSVLLNRGRNHFLGHPCPSPDGRHLAFGQLAFESNAWLLENF